jgi:superfamily II DNA or RNA helicase
MKSILDCRGGKSCRFPVGLYPYVHKKLNENGHLVIYKPLSYPKISYKLIPKLPDIKFEPYQKKMIANVGPRSRGILVGPTGSGKTVVMGGIVDKLNIPTTIIITPTKQILNQTYDRFTNWFPEYEIGKVGDGEKKDGHIIISLFQSLRKLKVKKCDLVIVDECHRMNKSIIDILKYLLPKTYYRYGLTATPQLKKDFSKWASMVGCIGPIIHETTDQQAIERVTDVQINLLRFICNRPTGNNYQEVLRHDVLFSIDRCVKMLEAAKQVSLNDGGNCLILLDEVEHGSIMVEVAQQMGLKPLFAHGKNKGNINDKIKSKLNNRQAQLVIATSVFGIGTDIPNVDCVGLASARKSYIDTVQKIGRGRRRVEGKNKLKVIDFIDNVKGKNRFYKHFYSHSIERLNIYKEKEWEIKKLYVI